LESFIRHVTNTLVEDFVTDPEGPMLGLSTDYINKLLPDEVDRLGCENRDIVEQRLQLDSRIKVLRTAEGTARTALAKTSH
jgi:hypothetical protein